MRAQTEDQRGFTLLEVMIAMAVLALALPVLLGLRNRDVDTIDRARTLTTATLLAQEKLFEAELEAFPPIGEQRGDFNGPPPGYTINPGGENRGPGFRWIRYVATTPFDFVRDVRIRVVWVNGTVEESVELTTYVFQEPQTSS